MMTNTKMSIYNKYKNTYKKHVIENVFWDDTKSVIVGTGFEKANSEDVFIPKNKNDMSDYVSPKDYEGNGWTLNKGDYIIKGEIDKDEVSGIRELKDAFTIVSVDDKDFGSVNMHHFEIRGQ